MKLLLKQLSYLIKVIERVFANYIYMIQID